MILQKFKNWWGNVDENFKRVILTLIFSVTVVLLAILIYYVFFKTRIPETPPFPPTTLPGGTLPVTDIRDILRQHGVPVGEEPIPTLTPSELKPDLVAQGGRTFAEPRGFADV